MTSMRASSIYDALNTYIDADCTSCNALSVGYTLSAVGARISP